jgi:tetratricopeptide (TPR) repeat protein
MAIFLSLAVATGFGSWYLSVCAPVNQWRQAEEAGERSMAQGLFKQAERQYSAAVVAARRLSEQDPRLARSLCGLAESLMAQGKYEESLTSSQRALAIYKQASGSDGRNVAWVLQQSARSLRQMERPAEADAAERQAQAIRNRLQRTGK